MNHDRASSNLRLLLAASNGCQIWRPNGKLTLHAGVNGVQMDLIRELEEDEIYAEGFATSTSLVIPPGTEIKLEYSSQVEKIVIAPDLERMLQLRKAREREPEAYLVWVKGEAFFYRRGMELHSIPEPLRSYHEALMLWQVLKKYTHHKDGETESLWYFGLRRIEITPGFQASDLAKPIDVSGVTAFMSESDATETRKEILSSRIAAHLKDQEPTNRFSYLLHSVNAFARGLKEAMSIYLCEHSPEKLEEEAQKAAFDFTEKIETIVGGLEAKSLTIPAALLLAYKEVDTTMGIFGNAMIILSAALYLAGMAWVWFTQGTLLDLLHKAIEAKRDEFEKKGLDHNNPLLKITLKTLQDRADKSEKFAAIMVIFSFSPLIAAVVKWGSL